MLRMRRAEERGRDVRMRVAHHIADKLRMILGVSNSARSQSNTDFSP